MQTIDRSPAAATVLLILVSLGTVFFHLGSLPLTGADEPRYARIAEEMQQSGRWVTPVLEGKPWLEKPPLYYWITIPIFSLAGVSETTARLGPALLALLSGFAVLWLGARLWSLRAGLLGAVILLTSVGFAGYARGASTDMPLTACMTVALVILTAAVAEKGLSAGKTLWAYVFIGLAILAKGPVALVLAGGTGVLFWALDERGGSLRRWRLLPGVVIAAAVSLPWFWLAFRQNGFVFIAAFFINHNLARYVSEIHHHTQPFYYYIPVLAGLMFPWSGWLALLLPQSLRVEVRRWREWNSGTLFLVCWSVLPLLFFSLSASKLPGYILPSLPPLALLLGKRLAGHWEAAQTVRKQPGSEWIFLAVSGLVAIVVPIVFQRRFGGWETGIFLSGVILIPACLAFRYARRSNWRAAVYATLAQGILLVVSVTIVAYPVLGSYLSTRDIAYKAIASREERVPIVTFRYFDHTLFYYTGYRITEQFDDLESLERFSQSHDRFLVVTGAAHMNAVCSLPGRTATTITRQGNVVLLQLHK